MSLLGQEPNIWGALQDRQFYKDMLSGLTNAINRGSVAGLLGSPVDMASGVVNAGAMTAGLLGNKLGLLSADQMPQPSSTPFGGSEWIGKQMEKTGMVSADRNPVAEVFAGLLTPSAISGAGKTAWAMEQNAAKPSPMNAASRNQSGAIVYHGSPHSFDKFDMSKIGTGEGAQAYGHGLYFADKPGVAQTYRNALAQTEMRDIDGTVVWRAKVGAPPPDGYSEYVAGRALEYAHDAQSSSPYQLAAQTVRAEMKGATDRAPMYEKALNILGAWQQKGVAPAKTGAVYTVDLPDQHINKMLDWDKPLKDQPSAIGAMSNMSIVKNPSPAYSDEKWLLTAGGNSLDDAINAFATRREAAAAMSNVTGQQLWKSLETRGAKPAVELLRKHGITGIRYLDGGSRTSGKGTSNYVVFDDQLPQIIGRE